MAIKLIYFVAILLGGITLVAAAPDFTAFQVWLATFDPSKLVATKSTECVGKPNGYYPNNPDTCSNSYVVCISGVGYPQNCHSDWVFDSDVNECVNRVDATSTACLTYYPAPNCDGSNNGLYQPTEACSAIYYICVGGELYIQTCKPGEFFDPATLVCKPNDLSGACAPTESPKPPATVPPYGCSGKEPNFAYAINTCSSSFYTCRNPSDPHPNPGSCEIAGTVFDYEKDPAPVDSDSCISRTTAPGCLLTTTAVAATSTSTTTTPSTTTKGAPTLPTAPCIECIEP